MKLSKYYIISLTFILASCKFSEVFVTKALYDDAEVRGYSLELFFFKKIPAQKNDSSQFKMSSEAKDEFVKI
jgi:hypothetical protein